MTDTAQKFPSQLLDQLMVRMPSGMRPRLKAMAALNRRTLNAEVVFHLERVLEASDATAKLLTPADGGGGR